MRDQHLHRVNRRQLLASTSLALLPGWKSITKRKTPLASADEWKDKTGKLAELIR
jgi:ferredoxin